jgi:hypothetical protein
MELSAQGGHTRGDERIQRQRIRAHFDLNGGAPRDRTAKCIGVHMQAVDAEIERGRFIV